MATLAIDDYIGMYRIMVFLEGIHFIIVFSVKIHMLESNKNHLCK